MNLKLNIYEHGKIKKTYETRTCDILFGTIEDILQIIDIDKLDKGNNEIEIAKLIIKVIPTLKDLLKDIFIGLTDEELRNTKISELVPLFINICKFSLKGIVNTDEGK